MDDKYTKMIMLERERLKDDALPDFIDNAMGANFIVKCEGNAREVKELARKTLLITNEFYEKYPVKLKYWIHSLPNKFVESCSPELTKREVEVHKKWWSKLSYKKKMREARKESPWELSRWQAIKRI